MEDTHPSPNGDGQLSSSIEQKIDQLALAVKAGFDGVDARFDRVEERLTRVEATMVTKEYLDEKLGELRGDLIVKLRKVVGMVDFLATILRSRAILSDEDLRRMRQEFQVFPTLER